MLLELLLASVLGFIIYRFVYGDKEETLPLDDGWWGPGSRPSGREDESIRPFKVETSDEEIKVRGWDQAWGLGWVVLGKRGAQPVLGAFLVPLLPGAG